MNKKITVNLAVAIAILAMTVTFAVTMLLSMRMFDRTVAGVRDKETMYNKLAEVDRSVRANYYGEINEDTLNDMLAAGYLAGIGDANATYYTARQYTEYRGVQTGEVIGIGADVVKDAGGYARIVRVYAGSPAADAGLSANQFITRIGESDVRSMSSGQLSSQLQGEAGTSVALTVLDTATGAETPLELQRRQYERTTVFTQRPEGSSVGYIQITGFADTTADELAAAVETLTAGDTPVTGLVVDLRNTSSGTLENAMAAIDEVCGVGAIASSQTAEGIQVLATSDNREVSLPMAVVVNGSTSYGAELFAASIREFGKGSIVGTATAGHGTIQCEPVALSDGSAISYTTGKLLTGAGQSFDGTGLSPDVEVALTAEQEANFYTLTLESDPQLQRAFEAVELALANAAGAQQDAAESTPSESTPAESVPAESVPAESVPAETAPAEGEGDSAAQGAA